MSQFFSRLECSLVHYYVLLRLFDSGKEDGEGREGGGGYGICCISDNHICCDCCMHDSTGLCMCVCACVCFFLISAFFVNFLGASVWSLWIFRVEVIYML